MNTLSLYGCFVRNNIQNGKILNHWDDKLLHKLFRNIIYGLMKHLCRLISLFIYVFNSQLWIKIAVFCQKYWGVYVICLYIMVVYPSKFFVWGKLGYTKDERRINTGTWLLRDLCNCSIFIFRMNHKTRLTKIYQNKIA